MLQARSRVLRPTAARAAQLRAGLLQALQLAQGLSRRQLWGREVQDALPEVSSVHRPHAEPQLAGPASLAMSPLLPRWGPRCSSRARSQMCPAQPAHGHL